MPDASGNFKGISVPRIPWHEDCDACEPDNPHGPYPLPDCPPRCIEDCCPGCPDPIACSGIGCAVRRAHGCQS